MEPEREQLLAGVAEHRAQRLVDAQPRAVGGHERHADRGVVERGAELLVGARAGRLGGLAVGDVP